MNKNLTSGAVISYGTDFPDASSSFDGSLFFKTVGSDQGLYLFSFVQDSSSIQVGDQVGQGWNAITASGLYLLKSGDSMSGALTISTTNTGTTLGADEAQLILNNPSSTANARAGGIRWTYGSSGTPSAEVDTVIGASNNSSTLVFSTRGPTGSLTERLRINETGLVGPGGSTYWNSTNDGAGSGLDADLIDGLDSSYFRNASNLNTGTLASNLLPFIPVQQGGGTSQGTNKVYIGFNASSNLLRVQVDTVDYANVWPISISGSAASALTANSANTAASARNADVATLATTATTASAVPWTGVTGRPSNVSTFNNDAGYITSAAIQAALASYFSANQQLGDTGYQRFPGGLIHQWGSFFVGNVPSNLGSTGVVGFPINFPTSCDRIMLTIEDNSGSVAMAAFVTSKTNTQFSWQTQEWAQLVQNASVGWFALGH